VGWLCVLQAPMITVVLLGSDAKVGQNLVTNGILVIAGKLSMRRTKLLHLIKANL
jgi:hypothetical protein